ncbi:MAG: isoprenoid biosynthesis glyoxalase ElbB [Crocinitomicaceae bacterium]|nr:isoprenoid biosynthesis glyoxalase ElbB [Crocinitomicaceae bacterium]MCF8410975.1 isoprenoid biosynthesis glyoxalase ElbB [Crocinitomicaceae bacterium]MCF8445086.1 isoprenoid biosynthesis glyoxalase ElbB [Crocinitomicaceae bacterium]
MKIGVLLSGCGVYDGAEIQETVFALLAIEELGAEAVCLSVNKNQHHVVNHLTGEEMPESRNMLVEAARIARGAVHDISTFDCNQIDALVIPGGFGSAKNFTTWAFEGPNGSILPEIKELIQQCISDKKPIAALCVSPVIVALALNQSDLQATMTLGTDKEKSPYEINAFSSGLSQTGVQVEMKTIREIAVDEKLKIVSAPCYMMDASIVEIRTNIQQAIQALIQLI